jgi:hypothetical protein
MASWPPTLDDLRDQLDVDIERDRKVWAAKLRAAIGYIERAKTDPDLGYFVPPHQVDDLVEGTILLASRLKARGNSPDGLVSMGELGSSRVPSFDADIERLCEIGRYGGSVIV